MLKLDCHADILGMEAEESIREKFELLSSELDERARRAWAATEALSLGYGGLSAVHPVNETTAYGRGPKKALPFRRAWKKDTLPLWESPSGWRESVCTIG